MSHWFHRNPLKATGPHEFKVKMIAHDVDAIKICSDLKQSRKRILELLPDPHHSPETMSTAVQLYASLIRGLLEAKTGAGTDEDSTTASKLRHILRFRWSHSMLGSKNVEAQEDATFEMANLLMNVAFWHMKHAAMIAAKDDLKMEEAKDIHSSLRKASGLIQFVKDHLAPQLIQKPPSGSDLDVRVIAAYLNQCTAEAQEVTIARAIELKHNPSLISALANETSKMYTTAADSLGSLDQKIFGHWRIYFALKAKFYLAYAYNYIGENLLSQDKCGEAIRALQEAKKSWQEAAEFCKEYYKTKGPGTTAKPDQHPFFRKLFPLVNRTLEKCERENGFIYHQKVPYDPPQLEIKDKTFGLVSPETWEMPALSPLWTAVAYAAMDVPAKPDPAAAAAAGKKDNSKEDKDKDKESEGDLKPVKEVPIKESNKEPKNESGCVIS